MMKAISDGSFLRMTVSEARAVIKMQKLWDESAQSAGFDAIEASAWLLMVESARHRVALFEGEKK